MGQQFGCGLCRVHPQISAARPIPICRCANRSGRDWEELAEGQDSRISVYLDNADPENEMDWKRQHEWLAKRLNEVHRVLATPVMLKMLRLSDHINGPLMSDSNDAIQLQLTNRPGYIHTIN
jgi:hypothetical protein